MRGKGLLKWGKYWKVRYYLGIKWEYDVKMVGGRKEGVRNGVVINNDIY